MRTIRIKCPQCQQAFDITSNNDGQAFNTTCPNCNFPIQVKFKSKPIRLDLGNNAKQEAPNLHNMEQLIKESLKEQSSEDTLTREDLLKSMGQPVLVLEGRTYELSLGMNTVGRKSDTSRSTVQIVTNDRYMSRVNARIDISRNLNGSWHVTIASVNERNLVKVNGREVKMDDKFTLLNGQTVTMGHSELYFCLK